MRCEATHEPDATRWRCDCGGWLDLEPPGEGDDPAAGVPRRGRTPAVPLATIGGRMVRAKLEFLAPTLSFKDRGAAVPRRASLAPSAARRLVADSSGNAGTALAAYAARAGLADRGVRAGLDVAGEARPVAAHGAEVVAVDGDREDVARAAAIAGVERAAPSTPATSTTRGSGRARSPSCTSWSDWARLPDVLVVPVGNGTLVLGAHRALRELGAVDRCRIVAVQAAACAPIAAAFDAGLDDVAPVVNAGNRRPRASPSPRRRAAPRCSPPCERPAAGSSP